MENRQVLNKIPKKVTILNSANKTTKLYLHGDIGPDWFESVSLKQVKYQLANVKGMEKIEVHINSYGGDVFESIAILNYLKNEREEEIVTYVDGIAASGGSIIFMAGDKRIMPANTQLMIHNPWTITYGNAKELRKTANDLEKIQTSLEECYLPFFVGENSELQVLLDKEEFLTADESKLLGLATEVMRDTKNVEQEGAFKDSLIGKYAAMLGESGLESPSDTQKNEENEPDEPINYISNFLNLYNDTEEK